MNKIGRRLLAYLFRGILLSVPLAVTVYIVYTVFVAVDHIVPQTVYGKSIPGLGIVTLLAIFVVLGWLGGTFLAQPLIKYFKRLLDQVPLIKTLYNSVKDFLSAFVGQKKSFNLPVLVRMKSDHEVMQLGFITSEDLSVIGLDESMVAVYIPMSFSVAGNIYVVPRKNMTLLDVTAPEVMKFIVSGGVSALDVKPDQEPKH
ncbi:MAG: DUF502 domain-containing protein [Bacteroidota bacterium]